MVMDRRQSTTVVVLAALAAALSPRAAEAQRRACRVTEVTVTPQDQQVQVGSTNIGYVAEGYDANGNPCENVTFTWTSSNPRVAAIHPRDGLASANVVGVAVITAATGTGATRRTGTATLIVLAGTSTVIQNQTEGRSRPNGPGYAAFDRQPEGTGPAIALAVDPQRAQLVPGEQRALEFRAVTEDGSNAARQPILFTVEAGGERVLSVDSVGIVSALGQTGEGIVRLSVPGNARISPRQVRFEVRADTMRFQHPVMSLAPGVVETLAIYIPAQGRAVNTTGLFQFVSRNPAVATANIVRPVVTAVTPGVARIVAGSLYGDVEMVVNVHPRVASVALEPPDTAVTLAINGRSTVRARALAADGTPVTQAPVRWQLPDTMIAAYDTATGTLTGRRAGHTTLVAQVPMSRESTAVRPLVIHVVAGGLAVNRPRLGLPAGGRAAVEVNLLDDARRPIGAAGTLVWTSSADSVATIQGLTVVAGRPGRARLTGRTAWDSTVTVDVTVVGDMIVTVQRQGIFDLFMLWSGTPIQLTRDSSLETYTAFSPDLTRIAFAVAARASDPSSELAVMAADGSERRMITRDSATTRFVSWVRPAGDRLVYESSRGGSSQIWSINADGTGARQLTQGPLPNSMPAVAPDGQKIVYVASRELSPGRRTPGIFEMNIDGTNSREVVLGPRLEQPQYTADGASVLFLRDESAGRTRSKRVYRLRVGLPLDSAVAVTPVGVFVSAYSQGADPQTLACTVIEQQGDAQQYRVQLFNTGTSTFAAVPGMDPAERLSMPVLRPAPAAPAEATRSGP